MTPAPLADILVVDDTPANLYVLSEMLKAEGYRVRPVPGGRLALQAAEKEPPDLILLDIMMPEMDGFEVLARLRETPRLSTIPVIFISALDDLAHKVRGLKTGAADYVSKPFEREEVLARIDTHLRIRRLQTELVERNQALEESHRELRKLESLRDDLTHMIVHDMRSPLLGIRGGLELLRLQEGAHLGHASLELLTLAERSVMKLVEMASSILDVSRMEENAMPVSRTQSDLSEIAREAFSEVQAQSRERHFSAELPEPGPSVAGDRDLLLRVFLNLLQNAVKHTRRDSGSIEVCVTSTAGVVRAEVRDNGHGIPAALKDGIFDKFAQVTNGGARARYSTGLGLTFCKMAIEAHGGKIGVYDRAGGGSIFWFELPASEQG